MAEVPPRLLLVAHGTRVDAGRELLETIVDQMRAARPAVRIDLCYLDVLTPTLPDALAASDEPTVVVPLLLSTGYHVQSDIPAAMAGRADVRVARHLGPDPLLADALSDRLVALRDSEPATTLLVAAGSSRPEAAAELDVMGRLLEERLGRPVAEHTMADDLGAVMANAQEPVDVAAYFIAEGQFTQTLRAALSAQARVTDVLGSHPAVFELALARYDEVADS